MKQDFFNTLIYILILLVLIFSVLLGVQVVTHNQQQMEYYQKYIINQGV